MTTNSDVIRQIRLEYHVRYMREQWLPQFYNKWHKKLSSKEMIGKKLSNYLRHHFFKIPSNISVYQEQQIKPISKIRFIFTKDNLHKPIRSDDIAERDYETYMMNIAIKESLGVYENEDDILQRALLESLSDSDIEHHVVIDVNIYNKNPYQPIYIDDMAYYLTNKQIKKIQSIWKTINTPHYMQNIEYITCEGTDIIKFSD